MLFINSVTLERHTSAIKAEGNPNVRAAKHHQAPNLQRLPRSYRKGQVLRFKPQKHRRTPPNDYDYAGPFGQEQSKYSSHKNTVNRSRKGPTTRDGVYERLVTTLQKLWATLKSRARLRSILYAMRTINLSVYRKNFRDAWQRPFHEDMFSHAVECSSNHIWWTTEHASSTTEHANNSCQLHNNWGVQWFLV